MEVRGRIEKNRQSTASARMDSVRDKNLLLYRRYFLTVTHPEKKDSRIIARVNFFYQQSQELIMIRSMAMTLET